MLEEGDVREQQMALKPLGLAIIGAAMLMPVAWLPGIAAGRDGVALFSQYLGMTAIIAMAISQLIATRWPVVEVTFGALDQSYRLHKWLGLWALAASFLHDTIDADMRGLGAETLLTEAAETAGEISLYGLLILVAITVATFIPYHLWKWTHRFIGVFFVLSAFHYLFILKPFSNFDPLGLYMGLVCVLGLAAYAYTSAPRRFRPSRAYSVTALEAEGNALAVTLAPEGTAMRHRAGQFAFVSFPDLGLAEPHPFTMSAAPTGDGTLRMSIAPLGDYTNRLRSRLTVGAKARVEGPFGHFGVARGPQVWVAAGIGITPFAAMAPTLGPEDGPVTLIYSVRERARAAHLAELEAVAAANLNFRLVLQGDREGRASERGVRAGTGGGSLGVPRALLRAGGLAGRALGGAEGPRAFGAAVPVRAVRDPDGDRARDALSLPHRPGAAGGQELGAERGRRTRVPWDDKQPQSEGRLARLMSRAERPVAEAGVVRWGDRRVCKRTRRLERLMQRGAGERLTAGRRRCAWGHRFMVTFRRDFARCAGVDEAPARGGRSGAARRPSGLDSGSMLSVKTRLHKILLEIQRRVQKQRLLAS